MARPLGWLPLRRVRVRGPSMSPTLSDADVVLAVTGARVRPGVVALVRWADRPGQLSVKRVVEPRGALWDVRGDNPFGSTDSGELGPAEVLAVVGWRLWPRPVRLRARVTEATELADPDGPETGPDGSADA